MKTAGLSRSLLLSLCVACTHAKTAAHPRQEERAAQRAEDEPGAGDSQDGSTGASATEKSEKKTERGAAADARPSSDPDGSKKAARGEGDGKGDGDGDEKEDDVAPEDIQVATTPQGLLEPGALDKVRDKLGVAKGDSVQGALRRFQRDHDLPATGMLDHETVERLGLSPDEIFERKADER